MPNDSITGRVSAINSEYVSIQRNGGGLRRVPVNEKTKMTEVTVGSQVIAQISEDGYASSIRRINE
jgi:hypothetical protein